MYAQILLGHKVYCQDIHRGAESEPREDLSWFVCCNTDCKHTIQIPWPNWAGDKTELALYRHVPEGRTPKAPSGERFLHHHQSVVWLGGHSTDSCVNGRTVRGDWHGGWRHWHNRHCRPDVCQRTTGSMPCVVIDAPPPWCPSSVRNKQGMLGSRDPIRSPWCMQEHAVNIHFHVLTSTWHIDRPKTEVLGSKVVLGHVTTGNAKLWRPSGATKKTILKQGYSRPVYHYVSLVILISAVEEYWISEGHVGVQYSGSLWVMLHNCQESVFAS